MYNNDDDDISIATEQTSNENIDFIQLKKNLINSKNTQNINNKNICTYFTYNSKGCIKKIVSNNFCEKHLNLYNLYTKIKDDNIDCTCKNDIIIKDPRSYDHVIYFLKDKITFKISYLSSVLEDATLTHEYIESNIDKERFYFIKKRLQKNTKGLKIILENNCQNKALFEYNNVKYCNECYIKYATKKGLLILSLII